MANIKEKVSDAAQSVADAAKKVGHKIAEGASDAAAFVKDKVGIGCDANGESKGVSGIQEHMDVYASCGKKVGVVDRIEGNSIKLTRKDSPDGQHHFVPLSWVGRVHDRHVHLTKNSVETETGWKSDASSCSMCSA
jgi:hypothetical protein